VTHARQKFAFGAIRPFGIFLGLPERFFRDVAPKYRAGNL
jgi:hypothetical protein